MSGLLAVILLTAAPLVPPDKSFLGIKSLSFSGSFGCSSYWQTGGACDMLVRANLDFRITKNWYVGLGFRKDEPFTFIYDGSSLDIRFGRFWSQDGQYSICGETGIEFSMPSASYGKFSFEQDAAGNVTGQAWRTIRQFDWLPFSEGYGWVNSSTVIHPFAGAVIRRKLGNRFFTEAGIRLSFGIGLAQDARYDSGTGGLVTTRDGWFPVVIPRTHVSIGFRIW